MALDVHLVFDRRRQAGRVQTMILAEEERWEGAAARGGRQEALLVVLTRALVDTATSQPVHV